MLADSLYVLVLSGYCIELIKLHTTLKNVYRMLQLRMHSEEQNSDIQMWSQSNGEEYNVVDHGPETCPWDRLQVSRGHV